jgi:hypothetical protein
MAHVSITITSYYYPLGVQCVSFMMSSGILLGLEFTSATQLSAPTPIFHVLENNEIMVYNLVLDFEIK